MSEYRAPGATATGAPASTSTTDRMHPTSDKNRLDDREFLSILAMCDSLDDPTYQAVSLLADAWQHALAASYRLGFGNGHQAGFWQAEHESAESWHRAADHVRSALVLPTQAELAKRRGVPTTSCAIQCGRCSRCIRAAAVAENLRRYGTVDYPDAQTRAATLAGGVR